MPHEPRGRVDYARKRSAFTPAGVEERHGWNRARNFTESSSPGHILDEHLDLDG
jgi:hypothetical protein